MPTTRRDGTKAPVDSVSSASDPPTTDADDDNKDERAGCGKKGSDDDKEEGGREGDEVTSLQPNDVLCGRGSGPNDHTGNVGFRRLILSRKAEYLSTSTRQTKAKIAAEIVEHVQRNLDPPGRFLKKLGASELKERKYESKADVWVVVDQDTALEKAKQALRQNRDKALVEDQLRASGYGCAGGTATTASSPSSSVTSSAATIPAGVGGSLNSAGSSSFRATNSVVSASGSVYSSTGSGTSAGGPMAVQSAPMSQLPHPGASPYDYGGYHHYPPPPHGPPPQSMYSDYAAATGGGDPYERTGGSDNRTSLPVSDPAEVQRMTEDFHRMRADERSGLGPEGVHPPRAAGLAQDEGPGPQEPPREAFPYAFGDPNAKLDGSSCMMSEGESSALTFGSVADMVGSIDPIPIGGDGSSVRNGPDRMMSSGTIRMVTQLTDTKSGESADQLQQGEGEGGGEAGEERRQQQNRAMMQQQFQQQQRYPGMYQCGQQQQQQYQNTSYRRYMQQQQPSMRGSLQTGSMQQQMSMRGSLRGGSFNSRSTDMSLSMSLSELTRDPSLSRVAVSGGANRTPSHTAGTGMQGIAEGADNEGSDNEEDESEEPEPMSGSSGSGMAMGSTSGAEGSSGKMPTLAVAPRPIELIQEDPDSLSLLGSSSMSVMKAVMNSSSSSTFSKMSVLMSGSDDDSGKKY